MRASCNGCRILRKGCSDDCTIRPSLLWLPDPEHQANATLFLAKFYGRAGLLNLLSAAPDRLRHAVFRSLLYEACGRIVNPIYGSVGLLWSGNWKLCQAAVEAVLKGSPVLQIAPDALAAVPLPPLQAFDIRHVSKNQGRERGAYKVAKTTQFKRSGGSLIVDLNKVMMVSGEQRWVEICAENESMMSSETVEFAAVEQRTYDAGDGAAGSSGHDNLRLELSLSLEAPSP